MSDATAIACICDTCIHLHYRVESQKIGPYCASSCKETLHGQEQQGVITCVYRVEKPHD